MLYQALGNLHCHVSSFYIKEKNIGINLIKYPYKRALYRLFGA